MSIPNTSEKSTDLNRQENLTKGNLSAKKVALYIYDSGTDTLQPQSDPNQALATRLDNAADPILYVGKAPVGSSINDAVWQIAKLDTSSGLIKTWAGSAGFTQVWDDRLTLNYS